MIILKSDAEIETMKIPAKLTAEILRDLKEFIRPGISTYDIDQFVESRILEGGMKPAFKGYGGFPASAWRIGQRSHRSRHSFQRKEAP